jgi:multidrug efflux pump subunit AcrA (membrane-fusion protein)
MPKHTRYQKHLFILCLLVSFSMVITACSGDTEPTQDQLLDDSLSLVQEISASGEVQPIKWATLSFSNIGEDLEVLVAEGDQVSMGDILVRNNNAQLEAALLQSQAALERAQFAYEQILNAPSEAALKSAFSAFIAARINLQQQEDNDASDNIIRIAQAEFDAARANYDAVFRGSTQEEIAAAEKDLDAAELAVEQAEDAFVLTAPFDGTVVEINVKSGENISAFQPLLVIADLNNLQVVTTDLSEVDVTQLSIGQTAEIVFDAISDQAYQGSITKIANKSSGTSSTYFEVSLSMENMPEELRWGMSAFVIFPID